MKKPVLLLLLVAVSIFAAPALAQVQDETGANGVFTPNRTATATLNASNAAATISMSGRQSAAVQVVTANLNAEVSFEASIDNGTTWVNIAAVDAGDPLNAYNLSSGGTFGGGANSIIYQFYAVAGVTHYRARVSTYTSGTAAATITASAMPWPRTAIDVSALSVDISGVDGSLGPGVMADALPVTFPTDQTALPVAEAGAPTIAYGQVSCTTSATQIAAARVGRRAINVTLLADGTDVYLGDASVTTGSGDLLMGIKGAARSLPTSAAVYCRVAAGSVSASYTEVY